MLSHGYLFTKFTIISLNSPFIRRTPALEPSDFHPFACAFYPRYLPSPHQWVDGYSPRHAFYQRGHRGCLGESRRDR